MAIFLWCLPVSSIAVHLPRPVESCSQRNNLPVHSLVMRAAVPPGLNIRSNLMELLEVDSREFRKNFLVMVARLSCTWGWRHSKLVSDRQRRSTSWVTVDCRSSCHLLNLCRGEIPFTFWPRSRNVVVCDLLVRGCPMVFWR